MKSLCVFLRRNYVPTSVYKRKEFTSVFLDLEGPSVKGQVRVKLFDDFHPEATENFLKMCEGFVDSQGTHRSFKGTQFSNLMKGFFMETEELKNTIYGNGILHETYEIKFDKPGMVGLSSDVETGKEESGSGFFITLRDMPNLDKYVAIGEVIEGLHVIQESDQKGEKLMISNCGFGGLIGGHQEHHEENHH